MLSRKIVARALASSALVLGAAGTAGAQYSQSIPEYSGSGIVGSYVIGTYTLVPSAGITFARIFGTFGNSAFPNTAIESIFLDGVLVASCGSQTDPCWIAQSPTPWSYTFNSSQYGIFSDGQAVLSIDQTGCCNIREGITTLEVDAVATPEPASMTLIATGLVGVFGVARRRRTKRMPSA